MPRRGPEARTSCDRSHRKGASMPARSAPACATRDSRRTRSSRARSCARVRPRRRSGSAHPRSTSGSRPERRRSTCATQLQAAARRSSLSAISRIARRRSRCSRASTNRRSRRARTRSWSSSGRNLRSRSPQGIRRARGGAGDRLRHRGAEVFRLLGPNGAGKTTTVEILEGYRRRDAGDVTVLGNDPQDPGPEFRQRIGVVLQQGGLFPQISALEALRLFAAFYPDAEDPDALLDMLQLREVARTRFRQLSGGQRRRLDVAIALAGDPSLLFLDEPTSGFDPGARRNAWEVIKGLANLGKKIFL